MGLLCEAEEFFADHPRGLQLRPCIMHPPLPPQHPRALHDPSSLLTQGLGPVIGFRHFCVRIALRDGQSHTQDGLQPEFALGAQGSIGSVLQRHEPVLEVVERVSIG